MGPEGVFALGLVVIVARVWWRERRAAGSRALGAEALNEAVSGAVVEERLFGLVKGDR